VDRLSDYDYVLPASAIAQTPLPSRGSSRLLWLHMNEDRVEHRAFREVASILQPGDLLVLNNTRVSAVRLFGSKLTGGKVELLLLNRLSAETFVCLSKPSRTLPIGALIGFPNGVWAKVEQSFGGGRKAIAFSSAADAELTVRSYGRVPLPPYIHTHLDDDERYQTVYAKVAGSAAAPTAGLHFSTELLAEIRAHDVEVAFVSLDVGIDTFRPITAENLAEHQMHGEICSVSEETAEAVARTRGRIVAVGTTTVRTLESCAVGPRHVEAGSRTTRLFIRPGYAFKVVDGMFTNFHMPRTSMLLMLAAMVGRRRLLESYEIALEQGYRFLSFGDSMLIL
jgi:S-adenosylmethionine:tRNA ribosyltransferase-isomerase